MSYPKSVPEISESWGAMTIKGGVTIIGRGCDV
jgi:hypothetical protein